MRRLLAGAGLLFAISVAVIGVARAQVPPLPVPTSTTTTVEPTTTTEPVSETTTTFVEPEVGPSTDLSIPEASPVPLPAVTSTTATPTTVVRTKSAAARTPLATAVSGSFAIAVATVLLVAGLFVSLSIRSRPGGFRMNDPRRRWRLLTGVGSLGLAAVVGLVGWLKLSLEPAVNRQIPYLASAGMTLVILAAIGGSLLVAEQLRSDDQRIADLEDAVRRLAETLEPIVESPPRKRH
jgi:hypothetical protein